MTNYPPAHAVEEIFSREDIDNLTNCVLRAFCTRTDADPAEFRRQSYLLLPDYLKEKVITLANVRVSTNLSNKEPSPVAALEILLDGYTDAYPYLISAYRKKRRYLSFNPLSMIEFVRGEESANSVMSFLKFKFFEHLRFFHEQKTYDEGGKRSTLLALDALGEALDKIDDAELKYIILGCGVKGRRTYWRKHILGSLSASERIEFDMLSKSPIEAGVDFGAMEAKPSLSGFAREAAARETGFEAQSKNPKPRIDSSRAKMNRPSDPSN